MEVREQYLAEGQALRPEQEQALEELEKEKEKEDLEKVDFSLELAINRLQS